MAIRRQRLVVESPNDRGAVEDVVVDLSVRGLPEHLVVGDRILQRSLDESGDGRYNKWTRDGRPVYHEVFPVRACLVVEGSVPEGGG